MTAEKGDRLVKAREARIALLGKKVAEQEGVQEEKRREEEEEDLAALEEQERGGGGEDRQSDGKVTEFVEDEDEEAEAEAAMAAFLAERDKAKASKAE